MASNEQTEVLAVIPARYVPRVSRGSPCNDCRPTDDPARRGARAPGADGFAHRGCNRRRANQEGRSSRSAGKPIITRPDHRTGTDRVAEVATHIVARNLCECAGGRASDRSGHGGCPRLGDASRTPKCTSAHVARHRPLQTISWIPNIVKVVRDFDRRRFVFFPRAGALGARQPKTTAPILWKHLGLYAFRRDALVEFPTLPPGELERSRTARAASLA